MQVTVLTMTSDLSK